MPNLKEWMDAQWQAKGVQYAGHGVAYMMEGGKVVARAGTQRSYIDKETKRRRAKLAMYNEKLRPIILAEATQTMQPMDVVVQGKRWGEPSKIKTVKMPHYTWAKETAQVPVETVAAPIPRKRVSRVKLAQAQEILSKIPQDELASFLARFGLSMSLAASIASLDNVEQIARQFLRATL